MLLDEVDPEGIVIAALAGKMRINGASKDAAAFANPLHWRGLESPLSSGRLIEAR